MKKSFGFSFCRNLAVAAAVWLVTAAPAWAQDDQTTGPTERSYMLQYVLVVVMCGLVVGAVCKPSYRHTKAEE